MTKIPVTEVPTKTLIEIKRIIATHEAKPEKQVQCSVCGTWKYRLDPCCDETDFSNQVQPDEADIRTLTEPL